MRFNLGLPCQYQDEKNAFEKGKNAENKFQNVVQKVMAVNERKKYLVVSQWRDGQLWREAGKKQVSLPVENNLKFDGQPTYEKSMGDAALALGRECLRETLPKLDTRRAVFNAWWILHPHENPEMFW